VEKKRSARDGQRLIEEFEGSGLTRHEFCERYNVPVTALDYWGGRKRELRNPG